MTTSANLLWYADYKVWGGIREAHNLKDTHQPIGLAGGENVYQFAANTQGHIDVLGLSATLSDFEDEVISPLPSWDKENKGSLGSWGTVMVGGVVLGTVGILSSEQVDSTESQSTTVNISSCSEKEKRKRCKKWGMGTPAQARNIVNINRRGPKGIKRIDKPEESVPGSQYHAHAYNDAALNVDGTVHDKHRGMQLFSKDDKDFLFCYGWKGV